MSNRRRPGVQNSYTSGYLHSPAWFARRDRWFRTQAAFGRKVACAACGRTAPTTQLELHHLDYTGVQTLLDGRWQAAERHDDLVPMHPYCHELLHRLIERDVVLARHRTRRNASLIAIDRLRSTLVAGRELP